MIVVEGENKSSCLSSIEEICQALPNSPQYALLCVDTNSYALTSKSMSSRALFLGITPRFRHEECTASSFKLGCMLPFFPKGVASVPGMSFDEFPLSVPLHYALC
jgi:hypothetical protein